MWLLALGRERVRRLIFFLLRGVGIVVVLVVVVTMGEGRVVDVGRGSGSSLAPSCGVWVWSVGSLCCAGLFRFHVALCGWVAAGD